MIFSEIVIKERDVKKTSIKAVSYSENLLEHSSDFSKLEIEFSV